MRDAPPLQPLLGIALKVGSTMVFTAMSAMVKAAADAYPTGEIMFFRAFIALVPLLVWIAWRGELAQLGRTRRPVAHLRRSLSGSAAMFCGFAALASLPLATATAIGYATPLLTTALAALLLKEVVRPERWMAVALGFAGMAIMLGPALLDGFAGAGQGSRTVGVLFGLAGAGFAGIASIEVRRLAQQEPTGVIVFYFLLTASVLSGCTIVLGWRMPAGADLALLVGAGIAGGIGQILLTSCYRFAPASVVAPFDYATLVWAALLGAALFGDRPAHNVLAGAILVVGAGLSVTLVEHRALRRARRGIEARNPT